MYPKSKFRKSYLRKRGVPEDKLDLYIETVNDIGNLQLLAAQLNEEKLTTDFDVWFAEQYKTDADKIQYRTINMLPDMEYSYANFLQFVELRKAKLKNVRNGIGIGGTLLAVGIAAVKFVPKVIKTITKA